ncbi:hypothetical protein BO71DRAFT_404108 [Aspergillus ellipticus CBS 707.79]|uniref:Rhodopsin domain-containing protein n=1 Tax=Aspergillus ellipticus CBS 707.79 TaxID=1448320 RepID=A0A319EAK2_9EURO|nr:hypothetical protein BO71DRAFT_404108 [Aspergillus ellipticus CBS 707.79]
MLQGEAIILSFSIVATLFMSLRMYTKVFVIRQMRYSDYSMIFAWAIVMGFMVPAWLLNTENPGLNQWDITMQRFINSLYYFHAGSIVYGLCCFFVKMSLLLQLLEIFGQQRGGFFWTCHSLLWVNFVFYVICTFLEIFACQPMAKNWNVLITTGHCLNTRLINVVASSINSASDLIILVLPQTRIWSLNMPFSRKITVSAVFLIGLLACTSSIVRLAYAILLNESSNDNNIAYYSFMAGCWTIPELTIGIIIGCLPSMPKLAKNIRQNKQVGRLVDSLQGLLSTNSTYGSRHRRSVLPGSHKLVERVEVTPKKNPDMYPLTTCQSQSDNREWELESH